MCVFLYVCMFVCMYVWGGCSSMASRSGLIEMAITAACPRLLNVASTIYSMVAYHSRHTEVLIIAAIPTAAATHGSPGPVYMLDVYIQCEAISTLNLHLCMYNSGLHY